MNPNQHCKGANILLGHLPEPETLMQVICADCSKQRPAATSESVAVDERIDRVNGCIIYIQSLQRALLNPF